MAAAPDTLTQLSRLSTEETFRVKSKAMALNLLDDCYDLVTARDETGTPVAPFSQKMEMLKTVAKFGDLEPKAAQPLVGTGFSIRIVYSGDGSPVEKVVSGVTLDEHTIGRVPGYLISGGFQSTERLATLVVESE